MASSSLGKISIKLVPNTGDDGAVRLSDLLVFLERLSGALGSVDRAINGRQSTYFNVSDLKYGSAVVQLEERVQENRRAKRHKIRSVVGSFEELIAESQLSVRPFWASPQVIKKVRRLGDPLPHTSRALVLTGSSEVAIDDRFRYNLDELLSPDTTSDGQLTGTLDAINMHGRRHAYIYPLIGHQKVVCDFSTQGDELVVNALQQRVRVYGELSRRSGDPFPYFVSAEQIEILAPDHDLPTLQSLRGTVNFEFEGSSVDYQRRLRSE